MSDQGQASKTVKGALKRGNLRFAVTLAEEVAEDRSGRPIELDGALRFLPLVAETKPEQCDSWARRWLARSMAEAPGATISTAADIAYALAVLPTEPLATSEQLERLTRR